MWRIFGALSLGFLVTVTGIPIASARQVVSISGYSPGTVIVKTRERSLYYVIGDGHAIRYPVGVGKSGKTWSGSAYIQGKYIRPAWSPPD
jgi:lipoprotein-anchoring transpeptidase ErfK/SrfK